MSVRFQTTIDTKQPTVLLIGHESVFVTELCKGISSLHLDVTRLSPENVLSTLQDIRQRSLFSDAYVCLWIDIPVFTDQYKKQEEGSAVLSVLEHALHVPLHFVCFDALYARKNGREGNVPTIATSHLLSQIEQSPLHAHTLCYQHVLYPFEGGLSICMRYLVEKIAQNHTERLLDQITPLWYGDVIAHLLTALYDPSVGGGIFSGRELHSLADIEARLRKQARRQSLSTKEGRFPFSFQEGTGIGKTPISSILDEFALRIPAQQILTVADVPQKKIFPIEKKKNRLKPKNKRKIFRMLGSIIVMGVVVYIGVVVYFFHSLMTYREVVSKIALSQSDQELFTSNNQFNFSSLQHLRFITRNIPIPYAVLGMDVHSDGIIAGIESTTHLFTGIHSYQQVGKNLITGFTSPEKLSDSMSTNTASLDESTKELSSIQAQIVQRDMIFDALYGVDGLSDRIFQSIVRLREEISQTRVLLTILSELSTKEGKRTVAFVALDPQKARPLLGLPTRITLVEFDQGKVLSIQHYQADQLDTLLKGKVALPPEISPYSSVDSEWKLSDGAWSVDGPTAARQIAWFISKQVKIDVDVAFFFPSSLTDTVDSLIAQVQGQEDKTLSTLQAKVLGIQTLSTPLPEQSSLQGIAQSLLFKQFKEGNLIAYSRDESVASVLKTIGWDGSVTTPSCPASFALERECIVSTRYLVEYDLAGEESLAKENQVHTVAIQPDGVHHTDEVLFPKTHYMGIVKLLKYSVDADAQEMSVYINGVPRTIAPEDIRTEFGKTTLSLRVDMSMKEKTTVTVRYTTSPVSAQQSSFVFFVQKQAGKVSEPFSLDLRPAKGFVPKIIAPAGTIGKHEFLFQTDLTESRVFAIGF